MPFRDAEILRTILGYLNSGVDLLAYDGFNYHSSGFGDDMGIYYFIPKIAEYLHLSLYQAIGSFYYWLVIFFGVLGAIGCLFLFKKIIGKMISLFIILYICRITLMISDVYEITSMIIVGVLPWVLYIKNNIDKKIYYLVLIILGLFVGYAGFIRSYAGIPVTIIFLFTYLFDKKINLDRRFLLISMFLFGVFLANLHFGFLINKRDNFLLNNGINVNDFPVNHPLWHSMYIGLGYYPNNHEIEWDDSCAWNMIRKISPNTRYLSPEYDRILKNEYIRLLKNDFWFVFITYFRKGLTIVFFIIKWINVSFLLSFIYRKPKILDIGFLLAIIFSSVYGFVGLPIINYLLGMFALCFLYNVISINYALDKGLIDDLKKVYRKYVHR